MKIVSRLHPVLFTLGLLAGCPAPLEPEDSGIGSGVDSGEGDGGQADSGEGDGGEGDGGEGADGGAETADGGVAADGGAMADAPVLGMDAGVTTAWSDCREAVVFGAEGDGCSFSGSCVECALVASPRQALCMGGRLRIAAAGPAACATGADAGVFTFPDVGIRDGGAGVDGGGPCPPLLLPWPAGGVCRQSTVDCIRAGGSPATCINADPTCLDCAQAELTACATQNGCDDEAGRLSCCFQANCPDGSCAGTICATQWEVFDACSSATGCLVTNLCFPSAPACPPAAWPAPTDVSCSAATLTCVEAATTGDALQACLDADTTGTPASPVGEVCTTCVNDELIACATDRSATANACDDELGLVECCLNAACPSGTSACRSAGVAAGGACGGEWSSFLTCVRARVADESCAVTPLCFP